MGHQQLYHPSGRIKRSNLRSLLVLALFGQVCGATFEGYVDFKQAVDACLREVPTGEQCCSSGAANCGSAGTTNMPDWDVSNILDMKYMLFPFGDAFNQDISRWDVSQVQSMTAMFFNAPAFDADITSWDTSSLVASDKMFLMATAWLAKYERKDGMEVWMGIGCSSGDGVPLPGNTSCFDGPPSAWRRKNLKRQIVPNYKQTTKFVPPINEGYVVKVYDGDSLTVASRLPYEASPLYRFSVRVNGIDCPEMRSKCGDERQIAKMAKTHLKQLIMDQKVKLSVLGTDKYGRVLADVEIMKDDKLINVAEEMLLRRFAVEYRGGKKTSPDNWLNYHSNILDKDPDEKTCERSQLSST